MSIYLNGFTEFPDNREAVEIANPATGDNVGRVFRAEEEDGDKILDIAEQGYAEWSAMPLHKRSEILYRYAALLMENQERIATLQCREMGKIITRCKGEVAGSANITRAFVEKANHLYGKTLCDNQPGLEKDIIFTRREPLGVFLCIVPFNFPLEMYSHKIIPALIMGNAVIIKVPAENPLALIEMTKLLLEAGVPAGAAQVVYAKRQMVTEKLIKTPRVQAVSITGSTKSGTEIQRDSAPYLHKVFLELGGNDPLIILDDADLDYAVENILMGRTTNNGQTCCASKRFIVHNSIYDTLLAKLVVRLDKLKRGNPMEPATEFSCLCSQSAAETVMQQIGVCIAQGAQCAYGGTVHNKTFVDPTVLTGVTKSMDVANDMEIFGPVIPLISFDTDEEAIAIANQTSFGLSGGIITPDTQRALRIASRIKSGCVVVNATGNFRHYDMPFGGYKLSGIGREGASITLEEFSQEKTYVIRNAL